MDIIEKLLDLQKQATLERSHYYVATCITEAIQEIVILRTNLKQKRSTNDEEFEEWWQYKIDHMGAVGILAIEYKGLCKEAWNVSGKRER